MLHRRWAERHITRAESHPFAADIRFALTLERQHGLFGQAVAVHLGRLAGGQRQHVHRLSLKTGTGPGNQTRTDAVDFGFDAVIERTDRAAGADLLAVQ
jgi:hypothetical protein